ncbi:MAG: hypothetical protein RTU30_12590 [Candidatus Thorarchaeota archaeon]
MRCEYYSIIILLVFSSLLMTTYEDESYLHAKSNQGLLWGFDEGARFDYTFHYHYETPSVVIDFTEQIYYIIENITPITTYYFFQMGPYYLYDATAFWANGTMVVYPSNAHYWWFAYPIGNWSVFLSIFYRIAEGNPETFQVIDTPFHIGYTISVSAVETIECSKSDGVIDRFSSIFDKPEMSYRTIVELTRVGYISDSTIFTGIIGASVIGIVVVVILVRRFRSS